MTDSRCPAGPDADRRWRDGGARPRSAYEAGISAGLDGDYNPLDDGYDSEPRRWRGRSHDSAVPTNTLFVRVSLNAFATPGANVARLQVFCPA